LLISACGGKAEFSEGVSRKKTTEVAEVVKDSADVGAKLGEPVTFLHRLLRVAKSPVVKAGPVVVLPQIFQGNDTTPLKDEELSAWDVTIGVQGQDASFQPGKVEKRSVD